MPSAQRQWTESKKHIKIEFFSYVPEWLNLWGWGFLSRDHTHDEGGSRCRRLNVSPIYEGADENEFQLRGTKGVEKIDTRCDAVLDQLLMPNLTINTLFDILWLTGGHESDVLLQLNSNKYYTIVTLMIYPLDFNFFSASMQLKILEKCNCTVVHFFRFLYN